MRQCAPLPSATAKAMRGFSAGANPTNQLYPTKPRSVSADSVPVLPATVTGKMGRDFRSRKVWRAVPIRVVNAIMAASSRAAAGAITVRAGWGRGDKGCPSVPTARAITYGVGIAPSWAIVAASSAP